MEANLLHNVRDVRPSECKILKSINNTVVCSGITNQRAVVGREFRIIVNWSVNRLVGCHASSGNQLRSVLCLRQEKASRCWKDQNSKKIMKCAKIGRSKFRAKIGNDAGKNSGCGGHKNNVINIEKKICCVIDISTRINE